MKTNYQNKKKCIICCKSPAYTHPLDNKNYCRFHYRKTTIKLIGLLACIGTAIFIVINYI